MDVLSRLAAAGIVPVVVLDKAEDAVPTARAMLAGGIDVMEITFRTAAAADSIRAVSKEVPEMLVGAGTVINLEQCKLAVDCGAKFIVSPGYDEETVAWCVDNGVAVTPGCVTPTEIMMAKKHDLKVLKFFPANVYGGLKALKSLSGPFPEPSSSRPAASAMKTSPSSSHPRSSMRSAAAGPFPRRTSLKATLRKSPSSAQRPARPRWDLKSCTSASTAPTPTPPWTSPKRSRTPLTLR